MYGSNKLAEGFCPVSGALWQGSNSKIENFGLAAQLVTVETKVSYMIKLIRLMSVNIRKWFFQILRMHTVLNAEFLQIWIYLVYLEHLNKIGLFSLVQMAFSPFWEFSAY